jgi:hypothetical protein
MIEAGLHSHSETNYQNARREHKALPEIGKSSISILSSAEFVAGFVPPDYVLDGVLQRRFVYSLTGKTGSGKTSILLLVAAHAAPVRSV